MQLGIGVLYRRKAQAKVKTLMPLRTDRLKEIRKDRGFTQRYMATRLGCTQPQYSDWENERFPPGAEIVAQMANVLQVTVDYLYGFVDKPSDTLKEEGLTDEERKFVYRIRTNPLAYLLVSRILDALPESEEPISLPPTVEDDQKGRIARSQ